MSDPVTTTILFCLIPALVFLLRAYYLSRYHARRTNEALAKYQTQVSRMGQYIGGPRTTVHSIINKLFKNDGVISLEHFERFFTAPPTFPDVSFYQGTINWLVMRSKTDKVIIRAGQNKWVDLKFRDNWNGAGQVGMRRSVYFFYDGRVSPSEQLKTLETAFNGDIPSEIVVDWERSFGGAFEGLRNVVAFMQAIETKWAGVEAVFYTGFFFFRENSNPITNAAQYRYLATRPLWLAWYGGTPRIPAPWVVMKYHQWGTPAVGNEWGVQSKEIDLNTDFSGAPDPAPEPENGEPMTTLYGTVIVDSLSIRKGPGTNYERTDGLSRGDKVEASESIGGWWNLTKVIRANGTEQLPAQPSYAYANSGLYIRTDEAPIPVPTPDAVRLVIESIETRFVVRDDATGKRYQAVVTDAPNVEFVEL